MTQGVILCYIRHMSVVVVIDGHEYRIEKRVADLVKKIVEQADRLADGTKTLKACLRGHEVKLTVEEEL